MKFYIIAEQEGLPSAPEFTARLMARWPAARAEPISNPERRYSLEFQVPMRHSRVEGLLHRTGGSINFEGDPRDMAEFVQWSRSLVAAHLPLLFCDEGLNGQVKVIPAMTAEEILKAFHESGG